MKAHRLVGRAQRLLWAARWEEASAVSAEAARIAPELSASLRNAHNVHGLAQLLAGDVSAARAALDRALEAGTARARGGHGHDSFVDIGGVLNDAAVAALCDDDHAAADKALRRAKCPKRSAQAAAARSQDCLAAGRRA